MKVISDIFLSSLPHKYAKFFNAFQRSTNILHYIPLKMRYVVKLPLGPHNQEIY